MVHVFTYTTEIKLNNDNQSLIKYIKDYLPEFNHIQRVVFYKIKNHYRQYRKINNKFKNYLYNDIRKEFNLTSRAVNSIIYNMVGRFESLKELKQYELNQLYKRKDKLEKELNKILNEKSLIKATKLNQKYINDKDIVTYKNLKVSMYWKRNKLNKLNQRIKNLEEEINNHNYKICFGTKHLLKQDYQKFKDQRDSELYFVGTVQETACNLNFQLEYNKKNNKFNLKVRKEIDLANGTHVYGQVYFNKKHKKVLKELLINKTSPLTYRIKVKNGKILLQVMFQYKHSKGLCVTRNSHGVIGVDFNKGFVSVSETDKYGNLVHTYNISYRFGKGNYTTGDFNFIAKNLAEYCLKTGKDLAIEKLNFNTKRTQMFKGKNKKYNEMLSSLAYSKFDKIITSKCVKNRIFLHKVSPLWTSYIAENKYCSLKKLNIHSGASYVIARRGQSLKDKLKN